MDATPDGKLPTDILGQAKAKTPAELLELPEESRKLANWLNKRGGATLAEVRLNFGKDEATILVELNALIEAGFVQRAGGEEADPPVYKVRFAKTKPKTLRASLDFD